MRWGSWRCIETKNDLIVVQRSSTKYKDFRCAALPMFSIMSLSLFALACLLPT